MDYPEREEYIYIVGEKHNGILREQPEAFSLVRENMGGIDTRELSLVLANVFALGQIFPGPEEALAAVIHAFVDRSDRFRQTEESTRGGRCTLITAAKRLGGEISVRVAAVIPVRPGRLNSDEPESFHRLLLEALPDFQEVFLEEAYARDSKIIEIIKESTMHHINGSLR